MFQKNLIIKTLFSVLIFFCYGASIDNQESNNYIITLEGERIDCYGKVSMDGTKVFFKNAEGKGQAAKQKNTKVMVVYNRVFLNLNISKKMKRLLEVYAYNADYILTAYTVGSYTYVYVWDDNFKLVEEKIFFVTGAKTKKNRTYFNEHIKKYFADCDFVIDTISKNIENNDKINKGILYYNCDESVSPLTTYMELF